MQGWIKEKFVQNEWSIVSETDFTGTCNQLEKIYDELPKQLIHRDVHPGNFLFENNEFSGYIDFDLSQKNIRIFEDTRCALDAIKVYQYVCNLEEKIYRAVK